MNFIAKPFLLSCLVLAVAAVAGYLTATPRTSPANDADQKAAPKSLKVAGHVEPASQTQMYARIVGYVQKVNVDLGDRVKKGQVLAELFVPEMEAELRQKEAIIAHGDAQAQHAEQMLKEYVATGALAAAQVKEAETGVKAAQTKLDAAKATHEKVMKEFENKQATAEKLEEKAQLVVAAKAALEEADAKLQTVKAAHEGSTANRDSAEASVKVAAAQRNAAKADAQRTLAMLHYAKIVAPFDGVVARRMTDVGDLAGPPGAQGTPLFVVMQTDPVRVVAAVPMAGLDADSVRTGLDAVVNVGGREIKGKITRTAGVLDHNQTLRVEIDLPNSEGKLLPGMSATVTLVLGKE